MSRTKNSGIEIYRKALFIFPLVILSGLLMQSIPSENFNISANSADPLVVTFFMDKRNPLNKYLAKFAWGWTSILMWLSSIIVLAGLSGLIGGGGVSRKRRNVAVRLITGYIMATLYWTFLVNWFFGPSVFDRIYTKTGGVCMVYTGGDMESYVVNESILTFSGCRGVKGTWQNGFDVSGHSFLLSHSAFFLFEFVIGYYLTFSTTRRSILYDIVAFVTAVFLGIWAIMLFFTSWKFHSYSEILSGFAFALIYWFVFYFFLGYETPKVDEKRKKTI
ncbi:hypothetical protein BB559_006219 [Furculomyces boomerangus]|uniref:Uncharacterized protein n=1 Tax=Furculomyces boomerangus TaxID=61424 RepID=A0A2T9Y495_9FUNG|nr:hypothetical protein BB559_006219 [Furculomyces boomerangus]